ncbi:type II secretion system F family protein [Aestuariibacter sp. AA17]|uniref:Type II secretion system F family protein n=1 Tax=Fluctibacter corallii TaxID=2984329 RepID=A0ABT3AAT2_9ALTE|nr:type II secretion system F family protein [Aestuariibacter sp. AA17]MCV2885784.1 type II secretion system F family protein [Aestuariibacter sp. AA17]
MTTFNYTARNAQGQHLQGEIDASDQRQAARMLVARDLTPIDILAAHTTSNAENTSSRDNALFSSSTYAGQFSLLVPRVKLDDLIIFARQMYSLTRSGIPILRAVRGLADTTNSKRMQHALHDVCGQLERGRAISAALNRHPHIFNQLFVSIVHVGENTGKLDDAFLQLSQYLEREQETRKQIKTATRYPLFVVMAVVIALVVMNMLVIPIFADMFAKFGAELPLMTRILISSSHFFMTFWPLLLAGTVALVFFTRRYLATEQGRYQWDARKLSLPIVGNIFERTLLGRFSRSFSMMLSAGIPLTTALSLVAEAVDNTFMASRITTMRRNIEKGESLTRVANNSELFTPLVMQMIAVGEETGRVDELLTEVAEYYEREVDYDLKSLTAKIEPVLISIVAGMVLVLALGIFTPMWDMMGAYRGVR